ncbi:MMPL family protein [Mycobacterium xenopi 3993]|nr:MMPL family protein [Mycobacterium xenopi 3993]
MMLLISIQSVFLAFKGVLMTVLSVAAAYGSLVMVFQWGWLEKLGFERISSIDSTVPPLVLAMTFGLSMDYEIFLLTRIRNASCSPGTPTTPSPTGEHQRPHHHQRGADHDRGIHRLRVRRYATGRRDRRGMRGRDRR